MKTGRRLLIFHALSVIAGSLSAQVISFSEPHGLYKNPIKVSICAEGTSNPIHYTTDGRIPRPSDPVFEEPLTLDRTTVLRAAAIPDSVSDNDYVPYMPDVATVSYLFYASIMSQPDNPEGYPTEWGPFSEIPGNAPADYGMDQELLDNKTFGLRANLGFEQLPVVSLVTDPDNLFSHSKDEDKGGIYIYTGALKGDEYGRGWERPASIEIFDGKLELDIYENCGIKIHGGYSRIPEKNPKHGFRIMFRKEYGHKKLKYQLFGSDSADEYNSLILRTFSNNSWQHFGSSRSSAQYMREIWARETQRKMGHEYIRWQYVHLFLNGMYWGMYNLSERPDDDWCSTNFGGDASDYDVYKDGALFKGYDTRWKAMEAAIDSIMEYSLIGKENESDRILQRLESLMDIDNFIDYMLINFYAGNTDWDNGNWVAYANREKSTGFRFMCWDSEQIFDHLNTNNVNIPKGLLTTMFHKLEYNRTFNQRLQDRIYANCYNEGPLTAESVIDTWNELYSRIKYALYDESARWGDYRRDVHQYEEKGELYTPDNQFAKERDRLLNEYFPKRTDVLIKQLQSICLKIMIRYDDGRIFVNGQAPSTVFSISGTEYSNSNLPSGIYTVAGRLVLVRP